MCNLITYIFSVDYTRTIPQLTVPYHLDKMGSEKHLQLSIQDQRIEDHPCSVGTTVCNFIVKGTCKNESKCRNCHPNSQQKGSEIIKESDDVRSGRHHRSKAASSHRNETEQKSEKWLTVDSHGVSICMGVQEVSELILMVLSLTPLVPVAGQHVYGEHTGQPWARNKSPSSQGSPLLQR